MSIRRLRTSLSLLVVLVLLALVASPAGAAQKEFEDRRTNFSEDLNDVFGGLPTEICGVEGPFDDNSYLSWNVENVIAWDDGRLLWTENNGVRLYKDGQLILRDQFRFHLVVGPGDNPVVTQRLSVVAHCTAHSETPGQLYRADQFFRLDRHGNLTVRGDECDAVEYFFCWA